MIDLKIIRALSDNFIYLGICQGRSFVVDPCSAAPVLDLMDEEGLSLDCILITHHHMDHTGGVNTLKKKTGCMVLGGDRSRIPGMDRMVRDGEEIELGELKVRIIATPGHTKTCISYYVFPGAGPGLVFSGDALFVGGCGRPFECSASVLWNSLLKLVKLPEETELYCGHEYTKENYEFSLSVEPGNSAVEEALKSTKSLLAKDCPTVPSTIGKELETNIFLRSNLPEIKEVLNMRKCSAAEVFERLRKMKNRF